MVVGSWINTAYKHIDKCEMSTLKKNLNLKESNLWRNKNNLNKSILNK